MNNITNINKIKHYNKLFEYKTLIIYDSLIITNSFMKRINTFRKDNNFTEAIFIKLDDYIDNQMRNTNKYCNGSIELINLLNSKIKFTSKKSMNKILLQIMKTCDNYSKINNSLIILDISNALIYNYPFNIWILRYILKTHPNIIKSH